MHAILNISYASQLHSHALIHMYILFIHFRFAITFNPSACLCVHTVNWGAAHRWKHLFLSLLCLQTFNPPRPPLSSIVSDWRFSLALSLNGGASKFAGKAHSHSHVRLCSSALFSCVIAVNDSSATLQTAAVLLAPAHASRSRSLKGLHARARLLDPLHAYEMIDIETRYIHVIYLLMTSMCCHKN